MPSGRWDKIEEEEKLQEYTMRCCVLQGFDHAQVRIYNSFILMRYLKKRNSSTYENIFNCRLEVKQLGVRELRE